MGDQDSSPFSSTTVNKRHFEEKEKKDHGISIHQERLASMGTGESS